MSVSVARHIFPSLEQVSPLKKRGHVVKCIGLVIEAKCPSVFLGEHCVVISAGLSGKKIDCEVAGFKESHVLLMPLVSTRGIKFGSIVEAYGKYVTVPVGNGYIGRVLNAFGKPIDGKEAIVAETVESIYKPSLNPLLRAPVNREFETGIRSIDSMLTLGRGQRVGIFAASGVGKSMLLSSICQHNSNNNHINIVVLVGERGREVQEFVTETLGKKSLARSVVYAATAEEPPLTRIHAVYSALAMAEYLSNNGTEVLLVIDSMTRFAMALREVGLAIGEAPTMRGYTTSVFTVLPSVVERCGNFQGRGGITGLFTVLTEGEEGTDPAAETLKAILDGHIQLSSYLAERGHYPAIDMLRSISRLFNKLASNEQREAALVIKDALADYEENRALIELNAEDSKSLQRKADNYKKITQFLKQDYSVTSLAGKTVRDLLALSLEVKSA